jgi:hypothetical protein
MITALAITAVILFVLGLGIWKVHKLVGIGAGIFAFIILLGVMLSAFGGVGFVDSFLNNAWIRYLLIGSASYLVGTVVGAIFLR